MVKFDIKLSITHKSKLKKFSKFSGSTKFSKLPNPQDNHNMTNFHYPTPPFHLYQFHMFQIPYIDQGFSIGTSDD